MSCRGVIPGNAVFGTWSYNPMSAVYPSSRAFVSRASSLFVGLTISTIIVFFCQVSSLQYLSSCFMAFEKGLKALTVR